VPIVVPNEDDPKNPVLFLCQPHLLDLVNKRLGLNFEQIVMSPKELHGTRLSQSSKLLTFMSHTNVVFVKAQEILGKMLATKVPFENATEYLQIMLKRGLVNSIPEPKQEEISLEFQTMYDSVVTDHIPKKGSILEVGAGGLDDKMQSTLMRRFPNEISKRITPTDINVHAKNISIQVDATELSKHYEPRKFSCVISSNFLNTLTYETLAKTLNEISTVLEENGILIDVSDRETPLPPVNSYYTNRGYIIFPYVISPTLIGVYYVKKVDLDSFLKKADMNESERAFFEWYTDLDDRVRENMIIIWLRTSKENFYSAIYFSEWIAKLKIPQCTGIEKGVFFRSLVTAQIISHKQFSKVEMATRTPINMSLGRMSTESLHVMVLRKNPYGLNKVEIPNPAMLGQNRIYIRQVPLNATQP
jgi:hypothetical protein